MYRILAIGNSFSEDALYFFHQICESGGLENEVINLYVGGCSLERHWRNIESNSREYQYQKNGVRTDRYVSVEEILNEKQYDVIVIQQASGDSGLEDTYEPFLGAILKYLAEHSDAQIYLNQTWAYEKDSSHEHFARYGRDQRQMFCALKNAYENAAQRHGLPLIRSGEVIQAIRETPYFKDGGRCITRDGFHLNYLYGRYAAALTWAKKAAGIDIAASRYIPQVEFMPFEDPDTEIVSEIKKIVCSIG